MIHLFDTRTKTDQLKQIISDLTRDGKGWILAAIASGWLLSIGVRFVYPSVLSFIRSDFGISLSVAGSLLSALWIAYALGQFPGGILGDRIGEGRILTYSTALSAVGIFTVAVSVNIWFLFIGTIIYGFATALYGPTRFTILTDIFKDRSGTAVGLTMASGSIGNTVLPVVAASLAGYATWRWGFGILVPGFVVVTFLLWLVVPRRTSGGDHAMDSLSLDAMRQVYTEIIKKSIPTVVSIHIFLAFASHGFLGFYPTYLNEVQGFSPQVAAMIFGLYFAAGIVIQPFIGLLRDQFGSRLPLILISIMFFAGLVALQFASSILHFIILTLALSHRNGTSVVTNTYIADALPENVQGSGLGFLRTFWQLAGAMSPLFVGYLGDIGELSFAFLILAGVTFIALMLALRVPNQQP